MTLRYGAVLSSLRSLRGDPTTSAIVPTAASVPYRARPRRRGEIAPLADLYVPAHPSGASVVLVHGGGFVIGSRRMKPMRLLTAQLTATGIAVCALDYRMIFRGGGLAEALQDVRDGFGFWSEQAAGFGLDPRAISLVGLSAGATLALLAGAGLDTVAGVVSCFGLYEIDHLRGPATLLPRLLFGTADRRAWAERSPRFAPQTSAPTLLLHGSDDGLVPVEQAHRLDEHRRALGLATRLVIYDGAPHGFFNLAGHPAALAATREIVDHVGHVGHVDHVRSAAVSERSRSSTK
ncbi:MAG: alpha/beta hydrolase [Kofleriaceae bacterium]